MNILSLQNISKNYGKIKALKGVSFDIPKGTVFGILGPNGSGKTTLLSIVMSILEPTEGSYTIFEELPSHELRKKIGTLLETPNFYHYLSAVENLRINCKIKGVDYSDIDRVLGLVNLLQRKDSNFSTYSLGMKQRLAIASALLGDPEVLLLDEPTNGLDPVGIAEIRRLIMQLHASGKTIVMASHLLDEVEKVCSHVAILKHGTLLASGDVDSIFTNDEIALIGSTQLEQLNKVIPNITGYKHHTEEMGMLQVFYDGSQMSLEQLNRFCFDQHITLNHLQIKKNSLEAKFMELTGDKSSS